MLEQDYPSIQLIVIDDGSSDEAVDIICRYDERVVLPSKTKNQGAAVARNTGLAAAEGKNIAFLDSDNVWLPGKLDFRTINPHAHA